MTLGWLCLGWPDERPPAPGLERVGWSRRAPLADVVLHDRWPAEDTTPPRSHLRPSDQPAAGVRDEADRLRAPDQATVVGVRDQADLLLTPPTSLGVLDRAVDRLLALDPRASDVPGADVPGPDVPGAWGCLVLVGADHAVTRHDVSAYPPSVTADVLRAAVAGEALGVVAAAANGLGVIVVDAGVADPVPGALDARHLDPGGDLVGTDGLTARDVQRLVEAGRGIGRAAAGTGPVALGEVGVGNTTVAAALAAAVLGLPSQDVVGLGAGSDTAMLERKRAVVAAALARTASRPRDPYDLLAALGGAELAALTGIVLGAAEAGAAVVLDGLATSVAALLAVRLEPAVAAHLVAGHRSREVAHPLVLRALGLEPLLDLRLRAGEGAGACFATGMLRNAVNVRRKTGRTG